MAVSKQHVGPANRRDEEEKQQCLSRESLGKVTRVGTEAASEC